MDKLISWLAGVVIAVISSLQYAGIALLMAIESACIPLPSEIIMPFSGYLVSTGTLSMWLVVVAGAVGCVVGSRLAYALGAWGGRPLVERYGRYVLVSRSDLDLADRWFEKHGDITIFVGRLLPVVRTFIAFPAGVARMPLWRFTAYTFLGSLIWCWALAWIGFKLGQHWEHARRVLPSLRCADRRRNRRRLRPVRVAARAPQVASAASSAKRSEKRPRSTSRRECLGAFLMPESALRPRLRFPVCVACAPPLPGPRRKARRQE